MYLVIFLALLTLTILITGVTIMGRGGKINQKYANKLMIARVVMQLLTIIALIVVVAVR